MISSSHLRVYLPQDRTVTFAAHAANSRRKLIRASDHFVWDEPTGNDAFTVAWSGRKYVCPRFPRVRMLEGVLAFNNANPAAGLLSDLGIRRAASELARLRSESPHARSYILTSPWHVPLRWFAAFDPGERELYEAARGTSIRYRTAVGEALPRVQRAVQILGGAGFDDVVIDQVRDLEHWLTEFASDAMVELDYGSVAQLFSDGDLAIDESCADVHGSLRALDDGDFEEAGNYYGAVAGRWAPVQALTYTN